MPASQGYVFHSPYNKGIVLINAKNIKIRVSTNGMGRNNDRYTYALNTFSTEDCDLPEILAILKTLCKTSQRCTWI